jgi:hypothetical protein
VVVVVTWQAAAGDGDGDGGGRGGSLQGSHDDGITVVVVFVSDDGGG